MADSKSTHQIELTAIDKASSVINGLDKRFKSLGSTIDKALAVVGIGGVAALTGALTKAVKEAAHEEQTMKRLATAIEATGKSYSSVSTQVNSLLKSQQRLTQFADDESADALATLIQLTQNYGLSMKALTVTEDLAASGLFDLDSAATAVGKALTGNVMLLQRMGIKLKEGDDVLAALSARFGGTAAKNVDTFSGRIKQLQNVISDAFEALGGPMLEPLKNAAETLSKSIASPEMQEKIKAFANSVAEAIPKAVSALMSFSTWVITHGETILNFFKALIAIRVVSWAVSIAASLVTLAPAISTALAAAISPTGLIVLAAASGTTIGLTIGHAIAKAIRDSRPQEAIPDVLKDFVGPRAPEKFQLVGSGLNAQNLGQNSPSAEIEKVNRALQGISASDKKILSALFFGANTTLTQDRLSQMGLNAEEQRVLGARHFGTIGVRDRERSPYGDAIADRVLSQSFTDTPAGQSIGELEKRIQAIAPAFQYAMSAVTNAIVQGAIAGALKIKDVFNALRNAILQILADIAAKALTAGILSILFPTMNGGFTGAFKGLMGLSSTGGSGFRPAPVGASPTSGFNSGGGGVHNHYYIQGSLVTREQIARDVMNLGVRQARRGQNALATHLG